MQGTKGDTDVKNRLSDPVGESKGGRIWENSIETCILPYVKQMASASSMHEAGHQKPVLWDNPEGQGTVGRGGAGCRTSTHTYLWPIMLMYGKNHHSIVITLQLKQIN